MRKQGEGFYLSGPGKGSDDFGGQVADGGEGLEGCDGCDGCDGCGG